MLSIFISSTFNDMQAERDAIHQWVLPRLRRVAVSYGESVRLLDLRWGVNTEDLTEEASTRKVMDVCLQGIDNCDGYMVCLLGQRYGWVPEQKLASRDKNQGNGLEPNEEQISVTEMEIRHGIFQRGNAEKAILFFRDGIDGLPTELESRYIEKNPKLDALKERLEGFPGAVCHHYRLGYEGEQEFSGIQAFAEELLASLTWLLERIYGAQQELTGDQQLERLFLSQIREKSDAYLPVPPLEEALDRWKESKDSFLVIQADSGMGKSSFLARLCALPPEGVRILPFFCGLTPECSHAEQLVQHLTRRLSEWVGWPLPPEGKGLEEQVTWLTGLLYALKEPTWLVIDGLDQLTGPMEERLSWLPQSLPDTVRIVMTVLPGDRGCEQLGEFWPVSYVEIPELTDHGSLIRRLLARENKEISEELISLASERARSGNYLYITMLVRTLMLTDRHDFQGINARGGNIQAIHGFLRDRLSAMPEDLAGMSMFLMYECGEQVAPGLAYPLLSILASSPVGLRPQDLEALLPGIWEEAAFERLAGFLHGFLTERENGCYDFTHRILRKAADAVMNREEIVRLTEHLLTLPAEDPVKQAVALPYLLAAEVIDQAEELILARPEAEAYVGQFRNCLTAFTPAVARLLRRPRMMDWFRERMAGRVTDAAGIRLAAQLVERVPEPEEPRERLLRYRMLADLKTRGREERSAAAYYVKMQPLLEMEEDQELAAMLWLKSCESAFVDNEQERNELVARMEEAHGRFARCELSAEGAAAWMRCQFLRALLQLQEESGLITYGMISMMDYLRGQRKSVKSSRPYLADLRFMIRLKNVDEATEVHLKNLEQMVETSWDCLAAMDRGAGARELVEILLDLARLFEWVGMSENTRRICERVHREIQETLRQRYDVAWLLLSAQCCHLWASVTEDVKEKTARVEQACRIWERFFHTQRPQAYAESFKDAQLTWAELCLKQGEEAAYEENLRHWAKISFCIKEAEIREALEECRRYPDEVHQEQLERKRKDVGHIWRDYLERKWLKSSYRVLASLNSVLDLQYVAFHRNMGMDYDGIPYPEYCRIFEKLYLKFLSMRMQGASETDAEELKTMEYSMLGYNYRVLAFIRSGMESGVVFDDFNWRDYYSWMGNVLTLWLEYAENDQEKKRMQYLLAMNLCEQMAEDSEQRRERGEKLLTLLDELEAVWEKDERYRANYPYPEMNLHKIRGLRERAAYSLGEVYQTEGAWMEAGAHFLWAMDLAMELVGEVSQAVSEDQMHLETAILAGIHGAECMQAQGLFREAESLWERAEEIREAYLL